MPMGTIHDKHIVGINSTSSSVSCGVPGEVLLMSRKGTNMATYKAIALCRVSTSKQRIEGSSLDAQEVRVYECAEFLDAKIEKLWSLDTSSRKGKNLARKDLNEMYETCKRDKSIKYIIVDEADRFMRSMEEAYWWKVQLQMIDVRLAYANMPEITHEDNPMSVMREMMAFFQAEVSNHERITKTTDKMQAKIKAGYYPGMVHQGYKKSEVPSLHVPREPQWSLLKQAMNGILYKGVSVSESLEWLNVNGYRLQGGGLIDMYKFRTVLKQPYYAGIIKMSNWPERKNGLHKAIITEEEHERLLEIVSGKRKKFTVHKFNPLFPASNIAECSDCVAEGRKETRLVGYRHHNGKPERTRKFYERYRCRGCGENVLKDKLHDGISRVLDRTELIVDDKGEFLASMRRAWQVDVADSVETVRRLKQKQTMLEQEKGNLVRTMASNPELAGDFKVAITNIKSDLEAVATEIAQAENIEEDFEQFMAFSLDYVEHLKDNWFEAEDPEERIRLKELLFLDGLSISRGEKVRTPSLSPIYRYKKATIKHSSKITVSSNLNGGPGGT
jgi:site-specific DNA recombinase